MVELAAGGELWKDAPVQLEGQIVGLNNDHHLVGIGAQGSEQNTLDESESNHSRATSRWDYSSFATGLGHPVSFASQNHLFVVVDGSRLVSFDSTRGTPQWTAALADYPLKTPMHQICAGNGCVFATSQGTLRAVSTANGSIQMERYLGDTTPQWRIPRVARVRTARTDQEHALAASTESASLTRRKSLIAAWPLGSTSTNRHTIRLCDPETGAISQKLQVEGEPREVVINADGFGVIWTNDRISGVRFASTPAIADAGQKRQTLQP